MASPRPKSPRTPISSKKDEKEESFWDKIGTLGRKKRIKEGTTYFLYRLVIMCKICSNFITSLFNKLVSLYGARYVIPKLTKVIGIV